MEKNRDQKYSNVIYFIECYFNWSMDYLDLEKLIDEYLCRENSRYVIGLRNEINELYGLENPLKIKELVYVYGRRNLNIEKTKNMIAMLYDKLN